jgi:dihydrodipicolinate reductase
VKLQGSNNIKIIIAGVIGKLGDLMIKHLFEKSQPTNIVTLSQVIHSQEIIEIDR